MLSVDSGSISLIPPMLSNLKVFVQKELCLPPWSCSAARVIYVAILTFLTPGQRGSWEDSWSARQSAAKSLRGTQIQKASQARHLRPVA